MVGRMKVRTSEDDHTDAKTEEDSTNPLPDEGKDEDNLIQKEEGKGYLPNQLQCLVDKG